MTAIWLFLKGIPLWVWALILILCLGLAYGQHQYGSGKAEVQAQWDAQKAKDKAAAEKLDREYRAKEATNQAAAQAARTQLQQDIADGNQRAANLAADLRAERVKLRQHWRNGQCDVSPDRPANGGGEGPANAQAESLERIDRTLSEGEARINFLLARYAEAEKTCGTIPEAR